MRPRTRVWAAVVVAAAAAAAATVGATLLVTGEEKSEDPPRLLLDLGVRTDGEAVALRRAEAMYAAGEHARAARLFARYDSLNAEVGGAVAAWPNGTITRLEQLARAHPRSALVQLHLGFALFAARRREEAVAAWRAAARVEPDSPSAVAAGNLLHPEFVPGLPVFTPSFSPPRAIATLAPPRQLAALAGAARKGGVRARLLYGVALQRLGRPLSARRQYDAAAARAPANPEAQVAAAVARFDKDRPAEAFSRLGPLVRRFPRAPTVRFHLGLLLLWLGRVEEAKRELARARDQAPDSALGRDAKRFLEGLASTRTS